VHKSERQQKLSKNIAEPIPSAAMIGGMNPQKSKILVLQSFCR